MSPLDRLLYRKPDSNLRLLFTEDDRTTIEAARLAKMRGLATPVFLSTEETIREVDANTSGFEFLGLTNSVEAPIVKLGRRLVSAGVADGVIFGSHVDPSEAAQALGEPGQVSATVFLEFAGGEVVVMNADLDPRSVEVAEGHVQALLGPGGVLRRLDHATLRNDGPGKPGIFLCEQPDRNFDTCDLLRRFGGAAAYGAILLGASVPAVVPRPRATIEDILGSVALLAASTSGSRRTRRDVLPSSGAYGTLLH